MSASSVRLALSAVLLLVLTACGATTGGDRDKQAFARGSNAETGCAGNCALRLAGQNPDKARLTEMDVQQVLAQAVAQAQAMGAPATIAVVDRVGNVLAVFRMAGVPTDGRLSVTVEGGATEISGLDGLKLPVAVEAPCQDTTLDCAGLGIPPNFLLAIPGDGLAAISKAITGAYLSSEGSGLSTRVASQIVQRPFNPGEDNAPSGPLFGVQFSQLPCSDFATRYDPATPVSVGPHRSPLGLAADSGGFPLYKNGTVVGGVGVISGNFRYGLDQNVLDSDRDSDEIIAMAATFDYAVPYERVASHITIEGKTLRYSDVEFGVVSSSARNPAPLQLGSDVGTLQTGDDGVLVDVRGYYHPSRCSAAPITGICSGTVFGTKTSGIAAESSIEPTQDLFPGRNAFVFVDDPNDDGTYTNRYDPRRSGADLLGDQNGDGKFLNAAEVETLLDAALSVANQARSQIRHPLGSTARVTISVVDAMGHILGMVRTEDAPVFGADVSLQKARTATLFSSDAVGGIKSAAGFIMSLPDAQYLTPQLGPASRTIDFCAYVSDVRTFLGDPAINCGVPNPIVPATGALSDGVAFSDRAGGNLSRPNYPDGIDGNPQGPLSKPPGEFSIFSTGFQLDASFNAIVSHLLYVFGKLSTDVGQSCVGVPFAGTSSTVPPRLANGSQIFPGSVPIYEGGRLIGGIGVSGDGINQDDMIAFLGVYRASQRLGSVNNAPAEIRADRIIPEGTGVRLRYVNCPETPFVNSDAQRVCSGK